MNPLLDMVCRVALSKPFVILTGNSGTGKSRLGERLSAYYGGSGTADPFRPGNEIQSDRIRYFVAASDRLSIEFWNSRDPLEATKVVLPRAIIMEWVDCIQKESFDVNVSCREIRNRVSVDSRFSSQLHSFETHLKAAAFAVLGAPGDKGAVNTKSALVSVGADWTDNRAVVGFVNHLRVAALDAGAAKCPVYQSTAVLDLLLEADINPIWPHFLILDEMNLSHVERYFADFLSAMEARNGVIRLHDEGPRDDPDFRLPRFEGDPVGVPREIPYPPNLFVIGTVNIDETTYMFSPKVLDRAHVVEFQVDAKDIARFLDDPNELDAVQAASEAIAKEFLQLALDARSGKLAPLEGPEKTESNKHLINLLEILQRGRFEFAYRSANEVTRYLRVCRHLADDKAVWSDGRRLTDEERITGKRNWLSDLDDEILQKILPRLHGSRNRLGPLLGALACYLHTGDRKAAEDYFPAEGAELAAKSIGDPEFRAMGKAEALFPRSFSKIRMMSEILVEEQFVSFIC
jgi:hypothetical protein